MFVSFAFARSNWQVSILAYVAAFVGDVIDGHVARALNQCTPFVVGLTHKSELRRFSLRIRRCARHGDGQSVDSGSFGSSLPFIS